jgi:hypothetical protein
VKRVGVFFDWGEGALGLLSPGGGVVAVVLATFSALGLVLVACARRWCLGLGFW